MRVAFQGVAGSFSSMAARALFGATITPFNTRRFREIFELVTTGSCDRGVVPVENSIAGSVHENFDLLSEFQCSIIGEYYCPVQLHLMVPQASTDDVTTLSRVLSHPKALEQCSHFLAAHPNVVAEQFSDTAGAAQHIALSPITGCAAIASTEAAEAYGLRIVAHSIQNHALNATRFVAIGAQDASCRAPTKASLIVTLLHQPGSLVRILTEVATLGVNLTKIESRPIAGTPFEYLFHIDIEYRGSDSSGVLNRCIERLTATSATCRVLGVYEAAARSDLSGSKMAG
jgi:prephenate dehydratase